MSDYWNKNNYYNAKRMAEQGIYPTKYGLDPLQSSEVQRIYENKMGYSGKSSPAFNITIIVLSVVFCVWFLGVMGVFEKKKSYTVYDKVLEKKWEGHKQEIKITDEELYLFRSKPGYYSDWRSLSVKRGIPFDSIKLFLDKALKNCSIYYDHVKNPDRYVKLIFLKKFPTHWIIENHIEKITGVWIREKDLRDFEGGNLSQYAADQSMYMLVDSCQYKHLRNANFGEGYSHEAKMDSCPALSSSKNIN